MNRTLRRLTLVPDRAQGIELNNQGETVLAFQQTERMAEGLRFVATASVVVVLAAGGCAAARQAVVFDHIPKDQVGSTVRLRGSVRGTTAKDIFALPSGEVLSLDRSMNVPPEPLVVLEGTVVSETFKIDPDAQSARPQNVDPQKEYGHLVLRNVRLISP